MGSVAVLMLATPLFGMSLQPPDLHDALKTPVPIFDVQVAMDASGAAVPEQEAESEDDYATQMKTRNSLADLHRPFGIATWGSMLLTEVLGVIQYYNLYGFFAGRDSNPCVQGTAVFGQGQCYGTPWLHTISAGVTTGLYATTFTLALLMPDPDNLAEGEGEFASTLRMHKLLRWIHFGGMIAQAVLGILIANSDSIGLNRTNDYKTLQALATTHLATGLITFGALTWAGALMTF